MAQRSPSPLLSAFSPHKSSPKWSFHGKLDTRKMGECPGPGAYNHPSESDVRYTKNPQYGFGSASRDGTRDLHHPGPGEYNPVKVANDTSSKYGFGTSQRKTAPVRPDHPGPGAYRTSTTVGSNGPKYSATGRRDMGGYPNTPGPGSYMVEAGTDSKVRPTPRWGFGTSPRDGGRTLDHPGPGAYEHSGAMQGPNYSFRGRAERRGHDVSPGPGMYGTVYTQFG